MRSNHPQASDGWKHCKLVEAVGGPHAVIGGPFGSNLVSADYVEAGVPVIRGTNMNRNGLFVGGAFVFVSEDKADTLTKNMSYPGDIIVTQRGTMGQISIVPDAAAYPRFLLSQSQMAVRVPTSLNRDYIYYCLSSPQFAQYISAETIQTGLPHINLTLLREAPILFPPLPAQRRIAAILSVWDAAIEKTEQLIAAKSKVRNHYLQARVSWSSWPLRSLGEMISTISRPLPTPKIAYRALGIRSHGKGTFQRVVERPEEIDMDTVYQVGGRDLLVNITFAWEGAIALAKPEDEGCLVSHRFPSYEVNERVADREYLGYVVRSKQFIHALGIASPGGAGRNRVLNKKYFLNIRIPSPPLQRQHEIARLLNAADSEIDLLAKQRDALAKQKRGLMQKLLTGEWRVPLRDGDGDVDALSRRAAEAAE